MAQIEALKKSLKTYVDALARTKKELDKAVAEVDKYFGQNITLQKINESVLDELNKCNHISRTSQENWVKLYHEQQETIRKLKEQVSMLQEQCSKEAETKTGIKRLRRMRVSSDSR